jgi:hypothetical protein
MKLQLIKAKIKKFFTNPKIITGIMIGIVLSFLIVNQSKAADLLGIGSFTQKAVFQLLKGVGDIIASVAAHIIELEAGLLSLIAQVSVFTQMPVVKTGWKVSRDFANIFFIALLIYVAFCYILRINSKNSQKILVNVIVMAILINFSLMIGGIIIDFSNVFFNYFVFGSTANQQSSADKGSALSYSLANALKLNTFTETLQKSQTEIDTQREELYEKVKAENPTQAEMEAWVSSQMREDTNMLFLGVIRIIFIIIFSFVIILALGGLVGTLFVRLFWLWILLILAPLAWVLGIVPIPVIGTYAKQWWSNFLKWCFVAPIVGFFIFLALTTANNLPFINQSDMPAFQGTFFSATGNTLFSIMTIMQLALVIGLVIAGLIAGQKMGDKGSAFALGLAQKTGKAAGNAVKNRATLAALRVGRKPAEAVAQGLAKAPPVVKTLGAVTGVGALSRATIAAAEKRDQAEEQKRMKKYEALDKSELEKIAASPIKDREKAAAIAALVRKTGGDIDLKFRDDAMSLLPKFHMHGEYRDVMKAHPEWDKRLTEAAKKGPDELEKATSEVFKNTDISAISIPKLPASDSPYYEEMKMIRDSIMRYKAQLGDPKDMARSLVATNKRNAAQLCEDMNQVITEFYKDNDEAQFHLLDTISNYAIGAKAIENNDALKKTFETLQEKELEKKAETKAKEEELKRKIRESKKPEGENVKLYDEWGHPKNPTK